jgi:hypothetical protein
MGRKRRQAIIVTFRPAIFESDVPSFDMACLVKTLTEGGYLVCSSVG